jgi:hypothetical protein
MVPPDACSDWVYFAFTTPLGNDVVTTFNAALVTTMVNCCDTELAPVVEPDESVTLRVTVELPAAVGVPLITAAPVFALAFRVSPAGKVPDVICHLNGAVPPLPSDRL